MTPPFSEGELERLLQRPVRRVLTAADRRAFSGCRVVITGAGGSVGSELARRIAGCRPDRLTLVDNCELHLFEIERELASTVPGIVLEPVLADVTRPDAMRQLMQAARPHAVYHAAAYKHVAMMERAVCAAATVNIAGTLSVVHAAQGVGARFVLISSDKAAMPRSVMGATKRAAELAAISAATPAFRPIVVRFGNVLGSSGSVLTVMRDAIRRGRPIPLTDPAASRFLMTASEAVSLVMKADLLARRAETYWLDMGEPVRIGELARRLLELERDHGFAPVPVEIIGLRPGEKLQEELTTQGLRMCRTRDPRIWVARQRNATGAALERTLQRLTRRALRGDAASTLELLCAAVPEFDASGEARSIARAQSARVCARGALSEARSA